MGKKSNPSKTWLLSALLAIMPLCFAVSIRLKSLPIAILFLAGLWALVRHPGTRCRYRQAWPVLAACLLYAACAIVNVLGHGLDWSPLDLPSHVLVFACIAALFAQPLQERFIQLGFSATACVLGGMCLFQHYVQDIDRAYGLNGGSWGAIEFAMFLLVLALLSLIQLQNQGTSRPGQCLHALGALLGMYGALLTQSRGPLLSFIPVFLLSIALHVRRTGQWRRSLLLTAIILAGAFVATLGLQREMVHRLAEVKAEVSTYSHVDDAQGSVRERIEMWRTAWHAFIENPVTGVGLDQFGTYARQQIKAGKSNPSINGYDHPHNEYLDAAATGGIPGLIAILLVLFVPLGYFIRRTQDPLDTVATPALAGTVVAGMYILCGLTDNVFYRAMPHSLYFFLVLGFAISIAQRQYTRFHADGSPEKYGPHQSDRME
jgi:O-antigen ligase